MTREEEITQCLKHLISRIKSESSKSEINDRDKLTSLTLSAKSIVEISYDIQKYLDELNKLNP